MAKIVKTREKPKLTKRQDVATSLKLHRPLFFGCATLNLPCSLATTNSLSHLDTSLCCCPTYSLTRPDKFDLTRRFETVFNPNFWIWVWEIRVQIEFGPTCMTWISFRIWQIWVMLGSGRFKFESTCTTCNFSYYFFKIKLLNSDRVRINPLWLEYNSGLVWVDPNFVRIGFE